MVPSARRLVACFTLCIAAAVVAHASGDFEGRCVGVVDGDTIRVRVDDEELRVRLEGIDAPERGQPFSRKAKRELSSLVSGRDVRVAFKELDRWQRIVGRVHVDGVDTSLALVEAGLAWHFTKYSDDPALAAAEQAAHDAGRNLWSLPDPTPPWAVRAGWRDARDPPDDGAVVFHGNRRSRVFHAPGCHHYDCKNCTVVFTSREEARDAGFRAHRSCVE